MAVTLMRHESGMMSAEAVSKTHEPCAISALTNQDEAEVLDFLAERPIHTVFMASQIRDNGLVSPRNRGSFYACRDIEGNLRGVALIGHATLVEARTDAALAAFAHIAQRCTFARLIRGERDMVHRFWNEYASSGKEPRLVCAELLLEQRTPFLLPEGVSDLRQSCRDDLEHVVTVNSEMAFQEAGSNPLERDPEGFRQRTARRIDLGRVWVLVREGKLIFKADIVAETPEAVYLEGVYVHPAERGKKYGLRCLSQLGGILLKRTQLICLTVNQRVRNASAFYYKAGFRPASHYETIYL